MKAFSNVPKEPLEYQRLADDLKSLQAKFSQLGPVNPESPDNVDRISSQFQRFADEHAFDRIELIKSEQVSMKDKVDILGWLARYNEFLTLPMISKLLSAFKDNIAPLSNMPVRSVYINAQHGSLTIFQMTKLVQDFQGCFHEEESK